MRKNKRRFLPRSVWIGFDTREAIALAVARQTVRKHMPSYCSVHGLCLSLLREQGLYTRPTKEINAACCSHCSANHWPRLYDPISEAPMATQFSNSRFFVPHLVKTDPTHYGADGKKGWAMFCDCDVLIRKPLGPLFKMVEAHPDKALFCVFHDHKVTEGEYKMNRQVQVNYARKNQSSVMLFNCDHPANDALTLELLNSAPGRDLHRFCWLDDSLIGELPLNWNWLVGVSPECPDPSLVHFTLGGPWLPAFQDVPFADEWRAELTEWADL